MSEIGINNYINFEDVDIDLECNIGVDRLTAGVVMLAAWLCGALLKGFAHLSNFGILWTCMVVEHGGLNYRLSS